MRAAPAEDGRRRGRRRAGAGPRVAGGAAGGRGHRPRDARAALRLARTAARGRPALPASRRAIFFDVENASRAGIRRVIDHLERWSDPGRRTDFVAVGNWRVIGHDTAGCSPVTRRPPHPQRAVGRLCATGAISGSPSAPACGWRGRAGGDVLEIITSDRAFDAVGDVAAEPGHRVPAPVPSGHHGGGGDAHPGQGGADRVAVDGVSRPRPAARSWRDRVGSGAPAPGAPVLRPSSRLPLRRLLPGRSSRGRLPRRLRRRRREHPAEHASQTAPRDELIALVHDLMQRSPGRPLTLDTLANALKSRGFAAPRLAPARHAPPAHQGDRPESRGGDHAGGQSRGAPGRGNSQPAVRARRRRRRGR